MQGPPPPPSRRRPPPPRSSPSWRAQCSTHVSAPPTSPIPPPLTGSFPKVSQRPAALLSPQEWVCKALGSHHEPRLIPTATRALAALLVRPRRPPRPLISLLKGRPRCRRPKAPLQHLTRPFTSRAPARSTGRPARSPTATASSVRRRHAPAAPPSALYPSPRPSSATAAAAHPLSPSPSPAPGLLATVIRQSSGRLQTLYEACLSSWRARPPSPPLPSPFPSLL